MFNYTLKVWNAVVANGAGARGVSFCEAKGSAGRSLILNTVSCTNASKNGGVT